MSAFKNLFYLFVYAGFLVSTSACVALLPEPHKIDIHQGNIVDSEQIAKVEKGMSREQVQYLLGSPVINNPFHAERWDYLHYISKAGEHKTPRRITIYFADERVSRVEDRYSQE